MDLSTDYCGVPLGNPFILASAPPTASLDLIRRGFEAGWSGAVVKTLLFDPVHNLQNRFSVLKQKGSIIGFENLEQLSAKPPEYWYKIITTLKREFPTKAVIGSIMGDASSPQQWLELARGCQDAGADLLELNFSCPHGYPEQGRGSAIGQNPDYAAQITRWLKECSDIHLPVVPKLTAAVADIRHMGCMLADAGADGFCAINTLPSFFGFDLKTLRPKPDIDGMTSYGGYSGVGIKPIALRAVSELCQAPGLPIMASGGIATGFDAAEFMLLGAPAVQVCTEVMLRGFGVVMKMQQQLEEFMGWHNFSTTSDFIGLCKERVTSFGGLHIDFKAKPTLNELRCTNCGSCITACRDGGFQAITPGQNAPVFLMDACDGCSLCSHVCPTGAIQMQSV